MPPQDYCVPMSQYFPAVLISKQLSRQGNARRVLALQLNKTPYKNAGIRFQQGRKTEENGKFLRELLHIT